MKKTIRRSLAFMLSVLIAVCVPVMAGAMEQPFYSNVTAPIGAWQLQSPHMTGQQFVVEESNNVITGFSFYGNPNDSGQTISVLICDDLSMPDQKNIYNESFDISGTGENWYNFEFSESVTVEPGVIHTLALSTSGSTVWWANMNPSFGTINCRVINTDDSVSWTTGVNAMNGFVIKTAEKPEIKEYKINTNSPDAAWLVQSPHMTGQEFILGENDNVITGVRFYGDCGEAGQTMTVTICDAPTQTDKEILYTENFIMESNGEKWFDFNFSSPVTVSPGDIHTVAFSSSARTVWFANVNPDFGDISCRVVNTDDGTNWVTGWKGSGGFEIKTQNAEKESFKSNTYAPTAAYQIQIPHKAGQEFILEGDDNIITGARFYMQPSTTDEDITISVCDNFSSADENTLFSQSFKPGSTEEKWYDFMFDEPVTVESGVKHTLAVTTSESSVLWANISPVGDLTCRVIKTDNGTDWAVGVRHTAGFEIITKQPESTKTLDEKITELPQTLTAADAEKVLALVDEYWALPSSEKNKVMYTNKLFAAEENIYRLTVGETSPSDELFTGYISHNTALYQTKSPNKAGQAFISDKKLITGIKLYMESAADNRMTVGFYPDATISDDTVYSQTFTITDVLPLGWHTFYFDSPVPFEYGEQSAFLINADKNCVLYGEYSTLESVYDGVPAYNFDQAAYGGWVVATSTVAFQLLGENYTDGEILNSEINKLPAEITVNHKQIVDALRNRYEALDDAEKAKVTSLSKLVDAEEKLSVLSSEDITEFNKLTDDINELNVSLSDFDTINNALNLLNQLKKKYGEGITNELNNIQKLETAKNAYLEMANSFKSGDVDDSGEITAADALMALQSAVGKITLAEKNAYAAEVDGKENVTASDALMILQYSVGKIGRFAYEPEREFYMTVTYDMQKYNATYASLVNRTSDDGYANTSVTGAYTGMYVRDSSIQVMAHVINGDYELARKILTYICDYHKKYGYKYAIHVMDHDTSPISVMIQADTSFFLINSWCYYVNNAPDSAEKTEFINNTTELMYDFADYYYDNGYYNSTLKLIRNPNFEHSRDGSFFNAYDTLTNTYASQALHELAKIVEKKDASRSEILMRRANELVKGIEENLTTEVDGKKIYAEMQSISKMNAATGERVDDDRFYVGFSFPNISSGGAQWFALNDEYIKNTLDAYLKYGSAVYHDKYEMLEAATVFESTEKHYSTPNHLIGKNIAWELMLCCKEGRIDRVNELLEFVDTYSEDMYRETYMPNGGGGDTANQEHASWMVFAHAFASNYKFAID